MRAAAMVIAAALAWSVLAFGSVYAWAAPPLAAAGTIALLLARARPRLHDLIDVSALAILAVIACQLVPLPPSLYAALSPDGPAFHRAMTLDYDPAAWRPLSLDPRATRLMLALSMAAYGLHAATRRAAVTEGRRIARWIAWLALLTALLGIGGKTLFPDNRIYGFWTPIEPGAAPVGAIINRNHFAVWAIMAGVITLGGLAAHVARLRERSTGSRAFAALLADTRVLWLLFAAAVTVAAVVLTASRSGFAALVAAAVTALLLMRRRAGPRTLVIVGAAAALCLVASLSWGRPDRLLSRFDATASAIGIRQHIWDQSLDIARRYPPAGVGAGAFPAAMTYYQTGPRDVFFNHAHNQYIELAVEGGVLMGIPLAALTAGIVLGIRRGLRVDRGSYFWVRVGSAAALGGLAIACIWESPFRTPATLMLAAAAAGLATAEGRG